MVVRLVSCFTLSPFVPFSVHTTLKACLDHFTSQPFNACSNLQFVKVRTDGSLPVFACLAVSPFAFLASACPWDLLGPIPASPGGGTPRRPRTAQGLLLQGQIQGRGTFYLAQPWKATYPNTSSITSSVHCMKDLGESCEVLGYGWLLLLSELSLIKKAMSMQCISSSFKGCL